MTRKRIFLTLAALTLAALAFALFPPNSKSLPDAAAGFTLTWYHGAETCGPCESFQQAARLSVKGRSHWQFREVDVSKHPDFARKMGLLSQTGILLEYRGAGGRHRASDLVGLWSSLANAESLHRDLKSNMDLFTSAHPR